LARAAQELVADERDEHLDTNVTLLLPRRTYGSLERLLHDRTADKIAKAVSRTPGAAATIVPYDVQARINEAFPDKTEHRIARRVAEIEARILQQENRKLASYEHPEGSSTVIAIDNVIPGHSATIEGRVSEVEDVTKASATFRSMLVGDDSGQLRITFRPEHGGADILPGQLLRITGKPRRSGDNEAISMADPAYQAVE
jgi:hypothetical protein